MQRIERLSRANRAQQTQYIAASLSSGEIASPAFVKASIEYATRIGERLCHMLRDPSAPAPWTSYGLTAEGVAEVDVDGDLYHGSAGIALFLAYLDGLVPRPEFRRAAGRALAHAIAHTDRRHIGAFQGLGGLIYVLTHLHHLWQERGLLELAVRLSHELPGPIDADVALRRARRRRGTHPGAARPRPPDRRPRTRPRPPLRGPAAAARRRGRRHAELAADRPGRGHRRTSPASPTARPASAGR